MAINAVLYMLASSQFALCINEQRVAAKQLALAREMTIRGEYSDVQNGNREALPGLHLALAFCKRIRGTLVVADLFHLSRHAAFTRTVLDSGVPIAAADMPEADRTLLSLMAMIYERERLETSNRTKAAMQAAKARGAKLGNPNGAAAFGDRRGEGAVEGTIRAADDFARLNIQEVREMWQSGMSLRSIAKTLNQRGIATRRGGKWYATTVKNLLERNV